MEHAKLNKSVARNPTTLAAAAMAGDTDAIAEHLAARVDVNGEADFGGSALLHAAAKGQLAAVEALLAAGALACKTSKGGRNPLHAAAERDYADVVTAVLGASDASEALNARDKDGRTPLMLAAQGDAAAACEALLGGGADLEVADESDHKDTALLIAARLGSLRAAEVLARAGANFFESEDQTTSLAFDAARQGVHPSEERREAMYDMLLDVMLDRE
ncbi:ANKRD35 [Symbiodinium sp. KB8]|nr:ANKRD35 [Symbiodinium sp. KB8]